MCERGGICELFLLSAQFFCEPTTTLKIIIPIIKKCYEYILSFLLFLKRHKIIKCNNYDIIRFITYINII